MLLQEFLALLVEGDVHSGGTCGHMQLVINKGSAAMLRTPMLRAAIPAVPHRTPGLGCIGRAMALDGDIH